MPNESAKLTIVSTCPYCGSGALVVAYRAVSHKVDRAFGPFDLFMCGECGSLGTANPPNRARLADFYGRYAGHRPKWYNAAAADNSLSAQYRFYADFVGRHLPRPDAVWADIGAGHGEVASRLAKAFSSSTGYAIDIGGRPPALSQQIQYISADLNDKKWSMAIEERFDLVYAVAVVEHVLTPLDFVAECLSLLRPNGRLVLIAPDNGSLASKLLGVRWPYFEPGEHLSVPTRRGAVACLNRAAEQAGIAGLTEISAHPLWVGYSLRYLAEVLRARPLARIIPPQVALPLPTGILATVLQRAG